MVPKKLWDFHVQGFLHSTLYLKRINRILKEELPELEKIAIIRNLLEEERVSYKMIENILN